MQNITNDNNKNFQNKIGKLRLYFTTKKIPFSKLLFIVFDVERS